MSNAFSFNSPKQIDPRDLIILENFAKLTNLGNYKDQIMDFNYNILCFVPIEKIKESQILRDQLIND